MTIEEHLAEIEPTGQVVYRSARFINAELGRMWAMEYLDERTALIETLTAFVEGE